MFTVYAVKENSDMTEGRGPMVTVAVFSKDTDAWAFAETRCGVMGRRPPNGMTWRQYYEKNGYADVHVEPVKVLQSLTEHADHRREQLVCSAIKKLTKEEILAIRQTKNF